MKIDSKKKQKGAEIKLKKGEGNLKAQNERQSDKRKWRRRQKKKI